MKSHIANRDLGDENDYKGLSVDEVIARLEAMDKQGERYDGGSQLARRNPIRADTGPILQALITARKPNLVLELGTAYGLSGCYIASVLKQGARMDSIEFDEATAKQAQANFNEAGLPVKVHHGDATEALLRIMIAGNGNKPRYSCVFLDHDKRQYAKHLQFLIDNGMLMPDCLILADNVIDRATECAEFLQFMKQYPHVIVPTECGLLVGRV